jgi:hypothetical protein
MVYSYILVIRADRSVRVARKPRLAQDEIGIRLKIAFPEGWGTIIDTIEITAPDFQPAVALADAEGDA